jgi:hypothetical protein
MLLTFNLGLGGFGCKIHMKQATPKALEMYLMSY